jgi:type IV secretion system protein VirB11
MIAETIQIIAVLAGRGSERRLAELAAVQGLTDSGDYALADLTHLKLGEDHE